MTMTGLPLAVVFFLFFFLFLIHFQQPIHIGLCRQKFPHFLTGTPVLGVGFLLFLNTPPETVRADRTNGAAKPLKWCMVTAAMVH